MKRKCPDSAEELLQALLGVVQGLAVLCIHFLEVLADELGVFDLVRERTLTCYNGIIGDGCGDCPSCKLRRKGLEKYLARR